MKFWKLVRAFTIVAVSSLVVKDSLAEYCYTEEQFEGYHFCGSEPNGIETYALGLQVGSEKHLYVYSQTCGNHYNYVWAQGLNQFGNPIASCVASVFDVECGAGDGQTGGCNSAVDMFIEADWD